MEKILQLQDLSVADIDDTTLPAFSSLSYLCEIHQD
ncbi:hypothetical protein ABH941_007486 [Streptacidiphilus sp. EB103A]